MRQTYWYSKIMFDAIAPFAKFKINCYKHTISVLFHGSGHQKADKICYFLLANCRTSNQIFGTLVFILDEIVGFQFSVSFQAGPSASSPASASSASWRPPTASSSPPSGWPGCCSDLEAKQSSETCYIQCLFLSKSGAHKSILPSFLTPNFFRSRVPLPPSSKVFGRQIVTPSTSRGIRVSPSSSFFSSFASPPPRSRLPVGEGEGFSKVGRGIGDHPFKNGGSREERKEERRHRHENKERESPIVGRTKRIEPFFFGPFLLFPNIRRKQITSYASGFEPVSVPPPCMRTQEPRQ